MSRHLSPLAAVVLAAALTAAACTHDVTAPAVDAAAPGALYIPMDTTSPTPTPTPTPIVCEDSVQSGYGSNPTGGIDYCHDEP